VFPPRIALKGRIGNNSQSINYKATGQHWWRQDSCRTFQESGARKLSAAKRRKLTKITADIHRIEKSYFQLEDPDLDQRYFELKRKRQHLLRSIVLDLHLSIEDIITGAIGNALLRGRPIRSPLGQTIRDLLQDDRPLGFQHKLMLARSLSLVTRAEFTDLAELNTIRNRCSHTWSLDKITRRKIKPSKAKRPLLRWRGRNLYNTEAFADFVTHFTKHYLKLWLRHS
jgi:hypothetical protein